MALHLSLDCSTLPLIRTFFIMLSDKKWYLIPPCLSHSYDSSRDWNPFSWAMTHFKPGCINSPEIYFRSTLSRGVLFYIVKLLECDIYSEISCTEQKLRWFYDCFRFCQLRLKKPFVPIINKPSTTSRKCAVTLCWLANLCDNLI